MNNVGLFLALRIKQFAAAAEGSESSDKLRRS